MTGCGFTIRRSKANQDTVQPVAAAPLALCDGISCDHSLMTPAPNRLTVSFLMLTKLNTLIASRFAARSAFTMLRLDSLTVRAVIVIVVDVSMFRRIFLRICVIWRYLCHWNPLVIWTFNYLPRHSL